MSSRNALLFMFEVLCKGDTNEVWEGTAGLFKSECFSSNMSLFRLPLKSSRVFDSPLPDSHHHHHHLFFNRPFKSATETKFSYHFFFGQFIVSNRLIIMAKFIFENTKRKVLSLSRCQNRLLGEKQYPRPGTEFNGFVTS